MESFVSVYHQERTLGLSIIKGVLVSALPCGYVFGTSKRFAFSDLLSILLWRPKNVSIQGLN